MTRCEFHYDCGCTTAPDYSYVKRAWTCGYCGAVDPNDGHAEQLEAVEHVTQEPREIAVRE